MRKSSPMAVLLIVTACGSDQLDALPAAQPVLEEPAPDEPGVVTPPVDEPLPNPDPPAPCMFYGIDLQGQLWRIDPEAVTATLVGPSGIASASDIGIASDGTLLAIDDSSLYQLSPSTGQATLLGSDLFSDQVAGDSLGDGSLLLGGGRTVGKVDPDTLEVTERGELLPFGYNFCGDIAVIDATTAYATAGNWLGVNHLFELDLAAGTADDLGSLEREFVFGLDFACDGRLYGVVNGLPPPRLIRLTPGPDGVSVEDLGGLDGVLILSGLAGPAR